ncbi:3-methyl-2-oxobutanoate hydroxymethyltransferase [hydrothermal vent metagenome]|uniref:3-methyl-2-oxobutanoate hydroxymethyltransferase n=1 Tax=hydrothermal vent metagenome TaxID=652676 RepID=A0A1W1C1Z5_9ZZZZ
MDKKITLKSLQKMKSSEKIVMITAYDALFAGIFDPLVDIILVGDSLNMSFSGREDTISATMDQMIYHTQAVCRKAKRSFVLFDMPFGTYPNEEIALQNAIRAYQETGADAIKLEGGSEKSHIVKHLSDNAIAVFGHIGLKPQSVRSEGGYSIKGKSQEEKDSIIENAIALEEAGAVALIIEGVKPDVAKEVTAKVSIPTIGIGAGVDCDGQVLVWSDMLGFFDEFMPKFVKQYGDGGKFVREAVQNYAQDVKSGSFPDKNHTY